MKPSRRFRSRALAALVLASLGLYAVLALFVRQRTREIAVRVAMGAGRRALMGLVLKRGMTLVAVGVGVGLLGGYLGGEVLRGFLFGVAPRDPATIVGVTVVMTLVSVVACLVPATRAVRVAPVEALNTE